MKIPIQHKETGKNIPVRTPASILDGLDFTPDMGCTYGHDGDVAHGQKSPCPKPAQFTVNYHICGICSGDKIMGSGYGTWCADHLAKVTLNIQHGLRLYPLGLRYPCGKIAKQISDILWNVRPIK